MSKGHNRGTGMAAIPENSFGIHIGCELIGQGLAFFTMGIKFATTILPLHYDNFVTKNKNDCPSKIFLFETKA